MHKSNICNGNADQGYVRMCQEKNRGILHCRKGETVAYIHGGYPYSVCGSCVYATIRHKSCQLLVANGMDRCSICNDYRPAIRAMYSRFLKAPQLSSTPLSKMNVCHMHTPQRVAHIKSIQRAVRTQRAKVKRLTLKLEKLTASTGINIDEELGNDMQAIVNNHQPDINATKNDDFRRIFWEQQVHHTYMYMYIVM